MKADADAAADEDEEDEEEGDSDAEGAAMDLSEVQERLGRDVRLRLWWDG